MSYNHLVTSRPVLVLSENQEIREKIAFTLESSYGYEATRVSSVKEALKATESGTANFALVIVDAESYRVPGLEKFLLVNSAIPTVLALPADSHSEVQMNVLEVIDRKDLLKQLVRVLDELLQSGFFTFQSRGDEYFKIHTNLLLAVCPLQGDIFIRLNEFKYVKLFHQGDEFDRNDWEKYTQNKGIDYLYIHRSQTDEFIRKYQKDLIETIEKEPPPTLEEQFKLSDELFDTVQELGNRIGFTKDVQILAQSQVKLAMKTMEDAPGLKSLLAKMNQKKEDYVPSHSTMTGFIACAIASHMEWGSETTFHKLSLAAMLHDVTLTNTDLARCHTIEEVEAGNFSDEEKKDFRLHPIKGAEIARQFSEIPPDVDVIIVQHHENPEGTGFPRKLSHSYISPLSSVFILAHDVAKEAHDLGSKFNLKIFTARAGERYGSSKFRKALEALKELDF
jgi:putative nucleotidyltransferase with HDIG domain